MEEGGCFDGAPSRKEDRPCSGSELLQGYRELGEFMMGLGTTIKCKTVRASCRIEPGALVLGDAKAVKSKFAER